MAKPEYTPTQALELIMTRVRERSPKLAVFIQQAIDTGKDISDTEEVYGRRKRYRRRVYRKRKPYSDEEALQIATNVLEAFFVEQPLLIDSAIDTFSKAEITDPKQAQRISPSGEEKQISIELQTETKITKESQDFFHLKRIPKEEIQQRERLITDLRQLTTFNQP